MCKSADTAANLKITPVDNRPLLRFALVDFGDQRADDFLNQPGRLRLDIGSLASWPWTAPSTFSFVSTRCFSGSESPGLFWEPGSPKEAG
jgi:hypothetical protein